MTFVSCQTFNINIEMGTTSQSEIKFNKMLLKKQKLFGPTGKLIN